MLLTRAVAIACLGVLGWMLALVALLLVLSFLLAAFRASGAQLALDQLAAAGVAAGLGAACFYLARRVENGA